MYTAANMRGKGRPLREGVGRNARGMSTSGARSCRPLREGVGRNPIKSRPLREGVGRNPIKRRAGPNWPTSPSTRGRG